MTTTPTPPPPRRDVRIAIVGSGLTGLVATYLLSSSPNISVEIFERAPTLGMDSASITVPLPLSQSIPVPPPQDDSALKQRPIKRLKLDTQTTPEAKEERSMRIDVPMRAFTGGYYPQLLALYRHLGVRVRRMNFTYSFATLPASPTILEKEGLQPYATEAPSPTILYNGANGFRGVSLPSSLLHSPSPVSIAGVLKQIFELRGYLFSLLTLILGYLQLLIIAFYHHSLGHTSDQTHPLSTYTLTDLVSEPLPSRLVHPFTFSSLPLRRRGLYLVERVSEALLRRTIRLDEQFVSQTVAPLFSAVMTSSLASVWSSPATEILDYIALTLGRDHYVVTDGVRTVVSSLLTHIFPSDSNKIHTNAEVRSVEYRDGKAFLSVIHHPSSPSSGEMEREPSSSSTDSTLVDEVVNEEHGGFDHVIFATQANHTAHFLKQYVGSLAKDSGEKERLGEVMGVLERFKYERSTVVNHTDRTLLPERKGDWRDLNLVSPPSFPSPPGEALEKRGSDSSSPPSFPFSFSFGTMATHILDSKLLVMQTTNPHPTLLPHPSLTLSSSTFERAVIDVDSHLARQGLFSFSSGGVKIKTAGGRALGLGKLQEGQGEGVGIWVCGSWAVGIPLLEGCVVSARVVAEEILRREGAALDEGSRW